MKWLGKSKYRFLQGQEGMNLIEVLVAVAILGALGAGLLNAIDTNAKITRQLDEKVVATNLATAYFEAIKASPYDITEPYYGDVVADITVPPQYVVNVDIQFSSDGASADGITWTDTYNGETIQKINISVSREGGKNILNICTFKTKRVVSES
ncbi:prepilin-type N-terminal cleavage/methylation domain-containing protein [Chloroflexota bacterium]